MVFFIYFLNISFLIFIPAETPTPPPPLLGNFVKVGKTIFAGGKIILAGGEIILAGGKIISAGGKIIFAVLVTPRQSHPVRAREFLNNGM